MDKRAMMLSTGSVNTAYEPLVFGIHSCIPDILIAPHQGHLVLLSSLVGTSRPLPSQRLSHLKQSSKPKSICLHKTSLYRNTTHLAIQQTCHGNRSSTSLLFMPLRHLCCL